MGCFKEVHLERIPREFNANADALSKLASQKEAVLLGVIPLETLKCPSVPKIEETGAVIIMAIGDAGETWMTPILEFLKEGTLPEDKNEARRLKYKAARYVIYDNVLYRIGFNSPLLKCIYGEECNYIMREIHEGICGNHSGVAPSLKRSYIRGIIGPPSDKMPKILLVAAIGDRGMPIIAINRQLGLPPSLALGLLLCGGLTKLVNYPRPRGVLNTRAVVAIDYFNKWVEAEPLATISAKKIKDFVHKSIVCRYGIPYKLISDNGEQFDSKELRDFCEALGIKKDFSAVCHPQSNGHTEAINKIIKHTLKAKLEEAKGDWPGELPQVLWSYNTMPRSTTGETHFSLTYGCEAMVLVKVGAGSFCRDHYDPEMNEANHRLYLDMIEEVRTNSQIRLASYQQRAVRHYNGKVKDRPVRVGDLVLRRVMPNTKVAAHGVFGANLEGPYKVKAVIWGGTYHLVNMDDKMVLRAWNAEHLRKYYQ
ncbi:uncharacterized protein LOC135147163 [Daucus carota subsp. sativus]